VRSGSADRVRVGVGVQVGRGSVVRSADRVRVGFGVKVNVVRGKS